MRTAFETDLAETCAKRNTNVGLLAYSPLAGGALSGKYNSAPAAELANARFNLFTGFMERFNKSLAREAVAAYVKLAKSAGYAGPREGSGEGGQNNKKLSRCKA